MTEAFSAALNHDGLIWLIGAVLVAGLVRGFSGFGTAMIYLPVAAQFLSPIWAITTLLVYDLFGPLPNVPRAIRDGAPRDVLRLAFGMLVCLPIGVMALSLMAGDTFRYVACTAIVVLLVLLIGGFRYRGAMTKPLVYATGGMGGLLGGSVGLAGPPVIMLYMASDKLPAAIRANILLYLLLTDIAMLGLFYFYDFLTWEPIFLGLIVMPAYLIANVIGARMFDPGRERIYRIVAYGVIGASAALGLPIWD